MKKFILFIIIVIVTISVSLSVNGEDGVIDVDEYNKAIEAYKAYICENWLNGIDYFDSDGVYDFTVEVLQFAIIDMDGDGVVEIVLTVSAPKGDKYVLHYQNGMVSDVYFGIRGMNVIKKDGTHSWSNSAFHSGYSKLNFSSDIWEIYDICEVNGTNYPPELYYINGEEVSEEEFEKFYNEQDQKEDADWYDFTDENIENLLQTIPVSVAPKTGDNSVIFTFIVLAMIVGATLAVARVNRNNSQKIKTRL